MSNKEAFKQLDVAETCVESILHVSSTTKGNSLLLELFLDTNVN